MYFASSLYHMKNCAIDDEIRIGLDTGFQFFLKRLEQKRIREAELRPRGFRAWIGQLAAELRIEFGMRVPILFRLDVKADEIVAAAVFENETEALFVLVGRCGPVGAVAHLPVVAGGESLFRAFGPACLDLPAALYKRRNINIIELRERQIRILREDRSEVAVRPRPDDVRVAVEQAVDAAQQAARNIREKRQAVGGRADGIAVRFADGLRVLRKFRRFQRKFHDDGVFAGRAFDDWQFRPADFADPQLQFLRRQQRRLFVLKRLRQDDFRVRLPVDGYRQRRGERRQ